MFTGLDFGTTNSALAFCGDDADVRLARFPTSDGERSTFRSVLFFDPDERDRKQRPLCTAGGAAIDAYLEVGGGRFLQSIKSHLASRSFDSTSVYGIRYSLVDLVTLLLERLFESTGSEPPRRAVVGRPVRFVADENDEDADGRAEGRLREALSRVGVEDVVFELEPVAAAWKYEQGLDADELVLIADFGGGTTDFCLVEVGPGQRGRGVERVLGTDGVGRAGDAFDQRILEHAVAPQLGEGTRYDVIGGEADVPPWLFRHLSRWHLLSFLKSPKTLAQLKMIARTAHDRDAIERFLLVIDEDLGYPLHGAVESTKVALTTKRKVELAFAPAEIHHALTRADLNAWIRPDLDAMDAALGRLLTATSVRAADVNRVFLTGGTSLVPAVRTLFAKRFSKDRLVGGDELTSVAAGLALAAREEFAG